MHIVLQYTGDHYYHESGTSLSPIYKVEKDGTFSRYNWGFVSRNLAAGHTIEINQGSAELLRWANRELSKIRKARISQST